MHPAWTLLSVNAKFAALTACTTQTTSPLSDQPSADPTYSESEQLLELLMGSVTNCLTERCPDWGHLSERLRDCPAMQLIDRMSDKLVDRESYACCILYNCLFLANRAAVVARFCMLE